MNDVVSCTDHCETLATIKERYMHTYERLKNVSLQSTELFTLPPQNQLLCPRERGITNKLIRRYDRRMVETALPFHS